MKILLVNDDGVYSPGIQNLARKLSEKHEVTIVAPHRERSGGSHSITIYEDLSIHPYPLENFSGKVYAFTGTPADCTRAGLECLMKSPDLVISGINKGYNAGVDTLYSGTVSAAVEAKIYGFAAIAVSTEVNKEREEVDFQGAIDVVVKLLDDMGSDIVREKMLLNINIPAFPKGEIKVCPIGDPIFYQYYTHQKDKVDYLLAAGRIERELTYGTDRYFLEQGYTTITPMQYNLTDYAYQEKLENYFK